jgi:hypothetical protein
MTKRTYREVVLLALAIGCAACDGRSPSAPTPLPSAAPSAPTVTAISPSTGSTVRATQVTISGTAFLAGATVLVDAIASNVTVVNSTTITASVPAHAAGGADVIVTNRGGLRGTLTEAFNYVVEGPFTVAASTDAVDAGGQMSVSWTAPAARAGDWIALCRVGGTYEDDWWGETNGEPSGTRAVTAPTRSGLYEFRYVVDDRLVGVARSSPVTVR